MEKNTYIPHPVDLEDIEFPPQLEPLREAIAENVHEVWAAGRIREGWTYGPQRDDLHRKHPGLLPYRYLEESEKEYDRDTAMNAIKLIVELGYQIIKQ